MYQTCKPLGKTMRKTVYNVQDEYTKHNKELLQLE